MVFIQRFVKKRHYELTSTNKKEFLIPGVIFVIFMIFGTIFRRPFSIALIGFFVALAFYYYSKNSTKGSLYHYLIYNLTPRILSGYLPDENEYNVEVGKINFKRKDKFRPISTNTSRKE